MRQVDALKDQIAVDIAAGGFHRSCSRSATAAASALGRRGSPQPVSGVWLWQVRRLGLGDRNDQLAPARLDPGAFGRVRRA